MNCLTCSLSWLCFRHQYYLQLLPERAAIAIASTVLPGPAPPGPAPPGPAPPSHASSNPLVDDFEDSALARSSFRNDALLHARLLWQVAGGHAIPQPSPAAPRPASVTGPSAPPMDASAGSAAAAAYEQHQYPPHYWLPLPPGWIRCFDVQGDRSHALNPPLIARWRVFVFACACHVTHVVQARCTSRTRRPTSLNGIHPPRSCCVLRAIHINARI